MTDQSIPSTYRALNERDSALPERFGMAIGRQVNSVSTYSYFPSQREGLVKSILLDANVTGHLDTIARKGSLYTDSAIRQRIADLIERLDENVRIMPGLGAAESAMRRTEEVREVSNYHRRSLNALRLLGDDRSVLRAWLDGNEVSPVAAAQSDGEADVNEVISDDLRTVRQNFVVPSYALVLKAYQLYLQKRDSVGAFGELDSFAGELYGRGSREIVLGALLLAGNSRGRQMALSIMKLQDETGLEKTLDRLWNTSFDLTYSRMATQPWAPEFGQFVPQPVAFVTDDKRLGEFLEMIEPMGSVPHQRGGRVSASAFPIAELVRDDLTRRVAEIVARSGNELLRNKLDISDMQRIRRYKARKYSTDLEGWFAARYS
ncbi:hypothetical protein C8K38_11020 [Rhodococcus sp. OK611]|uniref:hypothetical protein n=1 Tax=unclassified Rhodococcus (in: high G+C Gram-positive bacteria) TaxID=192944 RepID=UPI000BDA0D32|nr:MULTISPECIES: hypothetical protein [unclassified Rhodococcus (in: high G+C Gram-positive bacteria)]PTR42723.1 hypothetical protein C8K38_11020 [Rhodococcus sp. OK611]SNX91920.1 hypothetical protein SAMN05447004_111207 [Rhodococcus sp. OK270]